MERWRAGINPPAPPHSGGRMGKHKEGVTRAAGREREAGSGLGSGIVYHEHIQQHRTFLANG